LTSNSFWTFGIAQAVSLEANCQTHERRAQTTCTRITNMAVSPCSNSDDELNVTVKAVQVIVKLMKERALVYREP